MATNSNPGRTFAIETMYENFVAGIAPLVVVANIPVVVSAVLLARKPVNLPHMMATYLLLGNLSFADLINGLAVFWSILPPSSGIPRLVCSVRICFVSSTVVCSVLTASLISCERYIYVLHGLTYSRILPTKRILIAISLTWVLSVAIGVVPATPLSPHQSNNTLPACWLIESIPNPLFHFLASFLISLMVLVLFINVAICATAVQLKLRRNLTSKVKGSAIIVLMSSSSMFLAWGPYFIIGSIYLQLCAPQQFDTGKCETVKHHLSNILPILGLLNSLMNPIVYAFWHRPFYESMKKLICRTDRGQPSDLF